MMMDWTELLGRIGRAIPVALGHDELVALVGEHNTHRTRVEYRRLGAAVDVDQLSRARADTTVEGHRRGRRSR
jgi:hypothetical protein